jgi:phospholipid/cholesterol/gamma-HCH transport system ATP-binding protein
MMYKKSFASVQLNQIHHTLPNGRVLFEDLNFVLPMGQVVWFKGDTGTGKSVLIKILLGLYEPTGGAVLINGESLFDMSFEEFLPYRINMGLSFDFGGLIHNRDIAGNLALPLEYHKFGTPEKIKEQVTKYLEIFNLSGVSHERPSGIVGGLRKAVCVARAFVHEPQILILDDPTTGLRGDTRERLQKQIHESIKNGQTVVIASDDGEFMKQFNPEVFEMKDKKMTKVQLKRAA